MRVSRLDRAIPLGLAAMSFALALAQRPGWASSDTKIDLHVSPGRFLADVASVWTPSGSLGHVQGGQYGGYLFPMGPFYAGGHALGLAPWLVHRLWLGSLLALAAWGTVRLLDDLGGRPRGVLHGVAGAMMVLSPYAVLFTARTSVTLLAYAALPWMLLAVHRGVRRPSGWWWPAAFALIVAATGGGVNAAVTAWVLLAPALLLVYEALAARVPWADLGRFALRAAVTTLAASLWWIAPLLVQASYGIDFLRFTEQPGTIWGTTSLSETLRLMGYWVSYIGTGFHGQIRPYFSNGDLMLFKAPVVVAGLLVPALALGGFAWTRRRPYAPFFLALVILGALIMTAGFPPEAPFRKAWTFTYNHVDATHFLRTTYKAGPLVALGLACLGGMGAAALWRWARVRWPARERVAGVALAAAGAGLLAVAAWPLSSGNGLDRQLTWKRVPAAWTHTGEDLDRSLPPNTRAMVLGGELFSFYRWGGTVDSILPSVTRRPVAVRNIVPYADLHAIDLFWAVDALVGEDRLVPGQLAPLLRLLGVGAVIANADSDIGRSGAPAPATVARVLAGQGLGRPDRGYGPMQRRLAPRGEVGPAVALPQVRRYDVAASRGIVRVESRRRPTIVDGSADALTSLAAFGALPSPGVILYAGDQDAAELRREAARGAGLVISDSNRRRIFVSARLEQNNGWTLGARDYPSSDAAFLNPFSSRGPKAQTVARLEGARSLRAPFSPGREQFPEHRPFAAVDGSVSTAWLGDSFLSGFNRYLAIGFDRPRDVPYVDVLPFGDRFGVVTELAAGTRHVRRFRVGRGWTRLRLRERRVRGLLVGIARMRFRRGLHVLGGGGIRELRIPGFHVRESLRPPVLAERALAGRDLSRVAITYLFERTTGDAPFRRERFVGAASAGRPRDRGDGETRIDRVFIPPAARRYRADAWVSASPLTADSRLDRLAGYRGAWQLDSSSRVDGLPGNRASRAFDGDPGTGWLGQWIRNRPAWISWRAPRPLTLRRLVLEPARERVRFPTRVRLRWEGGASGVLAVGPGGAVTLPAAVRSRGFRLDVVAAAFPFRPTAQERTRRAVGVGGIRAPGLPVVSVPRSGPLRGRCGDVRLSLAGRTLPLRAQGTVAGLDAGVPLRAQGCSTAALPARRTDLRELPGPFRIALLRLDAPAPEPGAAPLAPGRVVDSGRAGNGRHDDVAVALRAPAWLVLGESYERGWRAWCDGRSLGRPEVVDGYANGWRAPAGCRQVRFAFAPQRAVVWAYVASGLAGLLLLALLLLRRPGPAAITARPPEWPAVRRPVRWPLRRAAIAGLAVAVVVGFVFAIRAGVVMGPVIALALWLGVGPKRLALAAGALLLAEPAIYVLRMPAGPAGFNFGYAVDLIAAHWVAVAAIVLLGASLLWTVAPALPRRRGPRRSPGAASADRSQPRVLAGG